MAKSFDFNPLSGQFDLVNAQEFSISVTMDELLNPTTGLKATSQLIPNQWYLITDYQTQALVGNTGDGVIPGELYVGDVERILVRATSVDSLAVEGYSVDNPFESIRFYPNPDAVKENWSYSNEDGSDTGSITTTDYDTDWFSISETGAYDTSDFYVEIWDAVNEVEFYGDQTGLGVDFTFVDGVFTFINNPGIDFANVFTSGYGSYCYIYSAKLFANPLGIIIARYNYGNDFYADVDYRGFKVRSWKANVPNYTAGAKVPGYYCVFNGVIYKCLVATSGSPSPSLGTWQWICNQAVTPYPLISDIGGKAGLVRDLTQYQDSFPFPTSFYNNTSKRSTRFVTDWRKFRSKIVSNITNCNIYCAYNTGALFYMATNAKIDILSSGSFLYSISNSNVSFTECSMNTFNYVNGNFSQSVAYELTYSNCKSITNTAFGYISTFNTYDSLNNVDFYYTNNYNIINSGLNTVFKYSTTSNKFNILSANVFANNTTQVESGGSIASSNFVNLSNVKFLSNVSSNTLPQTINNCVFQGIVQLNNLPGGGSMNGINCFGAFESNTGSGALAWIGVSFFGSCASNVFNGTDTRQYCEYHAPYSSNTHGTNNHYYNIHFGITTSNTFNNTAYLNNNVFKGTCNTNNWTGIFRNMEVGDSFNSNTITGTIERGVIYASFQSKTITASNYKYQFSYVDTTNSVSGFCTDTPTSTLSSGGSFEAAYTEASGTITLSRAHYTVNCTANTFSVNLPTAVGIKGRVYNIKNSGTGVITVDANSTETIDGNLTVTLNQYDGIIIQSNNANWIILSVS